MKTSKVNGKKLSLDFGLDFPFPMGNPIKRRTKRKQFATFLRWFQRGWQSYFPFPSLAEQSGNLSPVSCKLYQCHRIRYILQEKNCFKLIGLLPLAARKDQSIGKAIITLSWLWASQSVNRRGCWLLLNSSFGNWVRRVLTGVELNGSKALSQKKLPCDAFYTSFLNEFERDIVSY